MKSLLYRPDPQLVQTLEQALAAVARAFPLPASHRADLPKAIRDLSRSLTDDRGDLARPYWAAPRLTAAYLRFFLPWNLYRLSWLLPELDLPLAENSRILDLGSGPLTLPLALWCARPELRGIPLHFTCNDLAMQPMERGRDIFTALAGNDSPWRFTLVRGPLEKALTRHDDPPFDCIMCANTLNELAEERGRSGGPDLERRLAGLTRLMVRRVAPQGRLFLLEPGTRLGGKIVSLFRQQAIELGCAPLAPCPHALRCPMSQSQARDDGRPLRGPSFSGWCHFTHPAGDAPESLKLLSAQAKMNKRGFALSCLLLQPPRRSPQDGPQKSFSDDIFGLDELEKLYQEIMSQDDDPSPDPQSAAPTPTTAARPDASAPLPVRVVSSPILLPGQAEGGRYACCAAGLGLLLNAAKVPSGALLMARQRGRDTDVKTGAILLERVRETARPSSPQKSAGKKPSPRKHPVGKKRI
jgi:hypothetical protein